MTIKSLQAWLLHKKYSGDTSVRLVLFTKELGLLDCLYKGGRTPKKQAVLQAFTPLWISFEERHQRYYIRSVECNSASLRLNGHSLFSGLYLNELLVYAMRTDYPDEDLFAAYVMALNGLAQIQEKMDVEAILRRFEWMLLKSCGHLFSLVHEARTGDMIVADAYYQFIAGEGFVLNSQHGVSGSHILALASDNLSEVAYLKTAKLIMRQAIDHLLGGREIKARKLYV
ncbi:DNA repair protein RecO [Legionella waltersii]|uniref:DNA repair protein RecO n=1 Tax=Legionella waltersii TaxID=66969 RepID=A0A0W1ANV6_9GAMM|nr:DNA repair protein RecO C-terminal domain-containing protein [Legionella waltersii]KTD83015.1 DNA repair protein recO [Legionella waltersii]SNV07648.1 DNA repair protein RecO (recombination protein O) [Legionella waltersii]